MCRLCKEEVFRRSEDHSPKKADLQTRLKAVKVEEKIETKQALVHRVKSHLSVIYIFYMEYLSLCFYISTTKKRDFLFR